jgi:hypothetical protein
MLCAEAGAIRFEAVCRAAQLLRACVGHRLPHDRQQRGGVLEVGVDQLGEEGRVAPGRGYQVVKCGAIDRILFGHASPQPNTGVRFNAATSSGTRIGLLM